MQEGAVRVIANVSGNSEPEVYTGEYTWLMRFTWDELRAATPEGHGRISWMPEGVPCATFTRGQRL